MTFAVLSGVKNQKMLRTVPGKPTSFSTSARSIKRYRNTHFGHVMTRVIQADKGFTHVTNGFNRNPGARTPGPVRPPANHFRPGQPNAQFPRQNGGGHRPFNHRHQQQAARFFHRPTARPNASNAYCYSCGDLNHRSATCPNRFLSSPCQICGRSHPASASCYRTQCAAVITGYTWSR